VRRVTIADVARHAGVSTAAVSKVLRNAYGVSPSMATKVRATVAELGYRPNAAARGLRGRSFTIGMLLDNIHNPFFADILDGVSKAIVGSDFQVFVGVRGFADETEARLADAMIDRAMDGLILVAPSMPRKQVLAIAKLIPTVVVGDHDTGEEYDSVVGNDVDGAGLVIDHLVGLGHSRIGHTSAPTKPGGWTNGPEQMRAHGYERAMRHHGLGQEIRIVETGYSEEGGYAAGKKLLDSSDPPTAIFAGADIAAFGVMRAAAELGLRIPDDVSLVGYDNTTIASLAPMDLTSVDQAGHDLGATAARLLRERMDGRTRAVLASTAPKLIARGSTAPPPDI
jgi:LacI family transcriptional regulator